MPKRTSQSPVTSRRRLDEANGPRQRRAKRLSNASFNSASPTSQGNQADGIPSVVGRFPLEGERDRETWVSASQMQRRLVDQYGIDVSLPTLRRWADTGKIEAMPGDASCSFFVGVNSTTVFAMNRPRNKGER